MMPAHRQLGPILLFLLLPMILATGCAGPRVLSDSYKKKVSPQAKAATGKTAVHPTQRPYKINGKTYYPLPSSEGYIEEGTASWYGHQFHGRKTSNGETYNMRDLTAAHRTLPMNTRVLVENLENGKEVVLRINDRGPFVKGRIIDLSLTGAEHLGMAKNGTARVRLTALGETVPLRKGNVTIQRFLPHQDFEKGDFYVQIGSFNNPGNAERLVKKVTAWGSEASVQTFDSGDRRFYRVQVRAGDSLTEARRLERVFGETGFPDAFVVAR